jgi:hypothetical protein
MSLCFHNLKTKGEFPDPSFFKRGKKGHNVQLVLDQLVTAAYTTEFVDKFRDVEKDRDFLESTPFRDYLHALSAFGVSSRYFHLNTVLGEAIAFNPPEQAWQDLEGKILNYNKGLQKEFYESNGAPDVVIKLLAESRAILIQCGRALARMLALGALGSEAKRHTGDVNKFLKLSDAQLLTVKFDAFHKDI